MEEYDGLSALTLRLDDHGSVVRYVPSVEGIDPEEAVRALETSLHRCRMQHAEAPPPDDTSSQSGRTQYVCSPHDRPMGWPGPRRWQRATWRLDEGSDQIIVALRDAIEKDASSSSLEFHEQYNCVLVNCYANGGSSIKWHSDDEKWYHVDGSTHHMVIGSLSLGAPRWFMLRSNRAVVTDVEQRRTIRIRLAPGSLIVMAGATQKRWEHCVPKDDTVHDVRYNLTFRRAVTAQEDPRLCTL